MPLSKPYSIARAELIADQIGRFATQHLHQLAGHNANLGFWISEAEVLYGRSTQYQQRFKRLQQSQVAWVREHDTTITRYCPNCRGGCEFGPQTPDRPQRVPSEDLSASRDAVRRTVRQFLVRLYDAGFISEAEVRQHAESVGASVEPEDSERGGAAR